MTEIESLLQSIKERADRATEGDWYVEPGNEFVATRKNGIAFDVAIIPDHLRQGEYPNSDYDADFIASAKSDVPRLVKAVRVLAEELTGNGCTDEYCPVTATGSVPNKVPCSRCQAFQRAAEILKGP